ncbi:MAG TPA: cytochrome c3 family protein [Dehalococcoidia bacterium]|nr:cytochrome c3 family protein [Dehalococcoidia bacterium]MDP7090293.1 cytochrome c3 family protein [Dehalococcoidia bacterium]MDP7262095.1 cytochrome c3 family protein [Dehalococcoidia bacterium]MDP7484681.1 cytochrome c3 family protein [Dehalococcoidia bacterium]HJP27416.1 cytochrome c3 family protein [Dehalococcoidia bacterium]
MASENDNSNSNSSSLPKMLVPVLAIGGLGVVAVIGVVAAFVITGWIGQPIPVLGFEQTFDQPIDFPHTIHASLKQLDHVPADGGTMEGLGLDCTFCHRTVTTQANAGIPPVGFCATCHQVIGAEGNPQLTILRDAADIVGDDGSQPVNWQRVHRLPDHVRFIHEPHIRYLTQNPSQVEGTTDGVTEGPSGVCSTCHGNVAAMKQVEQVESLKMGQCVDCHRDNGAPTDCVACHH